MSVRKLTEPDKQEILTLYRNPSETTSTLALRYGVSNSTISRLLKSRLSESEYETLIQQKRAARGQSPEEMAVESPPAPPENGFSQTEPEQPSDAKPGQTSSTPRTRRRSSAVTTSLSLEPGRDEQRPEVVLLVEKPVKAAIAPLEPPSPYDLDEEDDPSEEDTLDADLDDLDEDEDDHGDLEDDFGDDEDDDWEEDDSPINNRPILRGSWMRESLEDVQVLPLSTATLPKPCYLVVDARAELIARPLKDFGDLGSIPMQEVQQKTLPVFDNHRVARRFSNRTQRVIKVPDGKMLQKTSPQLQAKGITRLLIDGQVYSLAD